MIHNESALPEMPGLNQSLPEHTAWITVTHQLHCLVRDVFYVFDRDTAHLTPWVWLTTGSAPNDSIRPSTPSNGS